MPNEKSESVVFKKVPLGGKFIHNNMVWVKVERNTESCCVENYNAHVVGDLSEVRSFKDNKKVKILNG